MMYRTRVFGSRRLLAPAIFALLTTGAAHVSALSELEDTALSGVSARGLAFNLQNASLGGDLALTYRGDGGQRLTFDGLEVSRSDDSAATFSDPYRLQLNSRGAELADAIVLTTPLNSDNLLGWRVAADWSSFDGGSEFSGGALVVNNLQAHGNSLSITTPDVGDPEAIVFGTKLKYEIGSISLRPRGRDNPASELQLTGIYLGGRNGGRWEIASLDNQPATFRAKSDGTLQLELDWPRDKIASVGSINIDNIDVFSLLDPVQLALIPVGARVGAGIDRVQLQYLNLRLHP